MEETAETTVSAEQAELDAILAQIEELESQKAERDAKKESKAAAAAAATTTAPDASVADASTEAATTTEAETAKADKTDKTDKPAKPVQKETEAPTEAHTEAPAPTETHTQVPTQAPTEAPTQAPAPPPTTEAPTEHQHSWEPVYETQTVCVSEAWDEQVNEEHAVLRTDWTCSGCGWNYAWKRTDCVTGEIFEGAGNDDTRMAASQAAWDRLYSGESIETVGCTHDGFNVTSYGDGYRTVTTTVHHDAVYEDRQVQVGEKCATCGATR